jgi:hypothetical protein
MKEIQRELDDHVCFDALNLQYSLFNEHTYWQLNAELKTEPNTELYWDLGFELDNELKNI